MKEQPSRPQSPVPTGSAQSAETYAEWARRKGIPPYPADDCCADRSHCQTCRKGSRKTKPSDK